MLELISVSPRKTELREKLLEASSASRKLFDTCEDPGPQEQLRQVGGELERAVSIENQAKTLERQINANRKAQRKLTKRRVANDGEMRSW